VSSFGTRPSRRSRDGREADAVDAPPADPADVARQICLHQLEYAPRTRAELAATLTKKGIEPDVADEVLSRFTDVGLIDDASFAQMWVTSRHRGKGLAGRALSQELRRKGVDDDTAADAVAAIDSEQERATARALVDRKLRSTQGLAVDARVRRLAGMLARKGYSGGVAYAVVREALAEEGEVMPVLDTDGLSALD
jgi:regulatory protein